MCHADCASLLAGLASTCQSGLALSTNTNLKGADNATLAMAVAQTSVPASCCNSFQTFLDGVSPDCVDDLPCFSA